MILFEKVFPNSSLEDGSYEIITQSIIEDHAFHDITTHATVPEDQQGEAFLIAKQDGIICGLDLVPLILRRFDPIDHVDYTYLIEEGGRVRQGTEVLRLNGSLVGILAAERIIVNFVQQLSGIATMTSKVVSLLRGSEIKLLDTRKTHPGFRMLEKYAVRVGGATNHRLNLTDMFLIKENHIRAVGSIEKAILACQTMRNKYDLSVEIEVEVTNLEEFDIAHKLKVDRIMLDHFNEEMIFEAAKRNQPLIPLELSGNITLDNIEKIKHYPIQFISMGAITHSAPALDLSMMVTNK